MKMQERTNRRLRFGKKDRKRICREYMEIKIEEDVWNEIMETNVVKSTSEKVTQEEMTKAMKPGKAAKPYQECSEMRSPIEESRIDVMMKLSPGVVDGKEMMNEWPKGCFYANLCYFKKLFQKNKCSFDVF